MRSRVQPNLATAAVIVALTLAGFFRFPGHTFLQSDTQIYLPILEHLRDNSVFGRELLAQDPHVSFTIYDEVALLLRRVTGLDFEGVLLLEQLVFRALGLLGVYWIATSMALRRRMALLVTATFSLGATIVGPAVLTFEYEPVPRGFAVPLVLLAVGLVAHGRDLGAGVAASLAFLYHPPTTLPFWAVYFCLTLVPSRPAVMKRRILGLAPLFCAVVVLFVLSRLQPGVSEPQDFFSRLSPLMERLQRVRAPYNWISGWPATFFAQYVFLLAFTAAAFYRVRRRISEDLRFFAAGMPAAGALAVPVSWSLLEKLGWAVVPQLQPARAALFITVFAVVLGAAAAMHAATRHRWWEAALWMLPVCAVPVSQRVFEVLWPNLTDPVTRMRVLVTLLLAAVSAGAACSIAARRRWAASALAVTLALPFLIVPGWAKVVNYPRLHNAELDAVSAWARTSTPKDALFVFPDAGRDLSPGVFRARALRALYVDWKAGGQANFLKDFGYEWWWRWQKLGAGAFNGADETLYRTLGIDYFVLKASHRLPGRAAVYENAQFAVYSTTGPGTLEPSHTSP